MVEHGAVGPQHEVRDVAAGVPERGTSRREHGHSVTQHRYQEGQQGAFWDSRTGVLSGTMLNEIYNNTTHIYLHCTFRLIQLNEAGKHLSISIAYDRLVKSISIKLT